MTSADHEVNIDEYLSLAPRKRGRFLAGLQRKVFGRRLHPGLVLAVAMHRAPSGDERWAPALEALLRAEPKPALQTMITVQLARMQSPAALSGLLFALASPHPRMRWWAAWGLGEIRSVRAVPALIGLLGDAESQEIAADALMRIGDASAIGPLEEAVLAATGSARETLQMRLEQLRDNARVG